jgi:hypothetical protein
VRHERGKERVLFVVEVRVERVEELGRLGAQVDRDRVRAREVLDHRAKHR